MAERNEQAAKLAELAKLIAEIDRSNPDVLLLVGYMLGAVYGLREGLEHQPRPVAEEPRESLYEVEIDGVAEALARGAAVGEVKWKAGFYFHSAMHRIAALVDRVPHVHQRKGDLERPDTFWTTEEQGHFLEIVDAVNSLKHRSAGAGRSPPAGHSRRARLVPVEAATAALEVIIHRALRTFGSKGGSHA